MMRFGFCFVVIRYAGLMPMTKFEGGCAGESASGAKGGGEGAGGVDGGEAGKQGERRSDVEKNQVGTRNGFHNDRIFICMYIHIYKYISIYIYVYIYVYI